MKKFVATVVAVATVFSLTTGCAKLTDITDISEIAENSEVSSLVSEVQDIVDEVNVNAPTQDRAGNDIKVPAKVETIVSMAPSTTQFLIDLGLGDKIVGIDTNSATYLDKLPANVAQFDMMNPDNEAIAALKPDIVFTSGMSSVGGTSPFQSLIDSGICVADIPSPSSVEGIEEDLKFIGACVGKGVEAAAYAKGLGLFMDGVKEQANTIPDEEKKTVLVMMNVPSAEYPTVYTFGKGTYMNEMIEAVGAKNVFADQEGWLAVSVEGVLAANPDIILMDCNWDPNAAEEVKALEGWENVTAIQNGAVYAIDEDLCSRPNQHIAEAVIEWGKVIYADKFGDFSKSIDDFTNDLIEDIVA